MAQFARPTSTISAGIGWLAVGAASLHAAMNETLADDATTSAELSGAGFQDTMQVGLGSITDPNVSTGHIVRIRTKDNASIGTSFQVDLYTGVTLAASFAAGDGLNAYVTTTYTLTSGEVATLHAASYASLSVAVGDGTLSGTYDVTWIEFEVPASGPPPVPPTVPRGVFHPLLGIKEWV